MTKGGRSPTEVANLATGAALQGGPCFLAVAALRFFFTVTLDRPDLARRLTIVREPRRLPAVLSVEEVTLLLQAAPGPKCVFRSNVITDSGGR